MSKKDTVNLLGIKITRRSSAEIQDRIKNALRLQESISIFTPNPQIVLAAQKDKKFKNALESADLLLPDGIGIIVASKLIGDPLKERITGIDTAEFILSYSKTNSIPIFLLGGKEGVAERAANELRRKYPSLKICGTHNGYFQKVGKENDVVLKKITDSGAKILFVCLGAPLQEIWIYENKERLKSINLFIGLGGAVDVWSKNVRRAPLIIQKAGLEWLWRILQQPKRAVFFFQIPYFLYKVIFHKNSN